jgi:hypothetical protein
MDEVLKKATVTLQMQQRDAAVSAAGAAVAVPPAKVREKDLRGQIDYDAKGIRMRNPGSDSTRT